MKTSLLSWSKYFAAITSIAFLTACGGGGGGDNNSNSPGNTTVFTPSSLSGDQLTLSVAGEDDRQINLIDAGNWEETRNSTAVQGTYIYHPTGDGRTATVDFNEAGAEQIVALHFASTNSGTFSYTSGRTGQGSFTIAQSQSNPGTGGGGNPPPPTGNAPSSLAGKTMFGTRTFTSTGPTGQTHTYTFTATSFHDSDAPEESGGTYTYQPNTDDATLELTYTGPQSFQGDKHHINMHFDSPTQGTFTSTYDRGDGTTIVINGTFTFE